MEKRPDNVIPFPGPKKDKHGKRKDESQRKPTLFFDYENRRVMTSASLVTVMVLVALLNSTINGFTEKEQMALNSTSSQMRGIASVEAPAKANQEQNKQLIRELASEKSSEPVILGRRPNAIEDLRFGQLGNNYAIQFNQGKVKSLEFIKSEDALPKYLNDREQFLWKNQQVLPFQFDTVSNQGVVKQGKYEVETYNLSNNGEKVAKVVFKLDQFGRFLSMKVQKNR